MHYFFFKNFFVTKPMITLHRFSVLKIEIRPADYNNQQHKVGYVTNVLAFVASVVASNRNKPQGFWMTPL